MNTVARTIRPGMLVSLKTSVRGNVRYSKTTLETERLVDGEAKAKWETERTVADPQEYDAAKDVRGKASRLITAVCVRTSFGLLCPDDKQEALDAAVGAARRMAQEFNDDAGLTEVRLYVMTGKVASSDLEAVKAINSEVTDLIDEMADGVARGDVKTIRDAASRAKALGEMLSIDAAAKIQVAIDAARQAAKDIVRAEGEPVKDEAALRRIKSAGATFLDMDDAAEVRTPKRRQGALDLVAE